MKPELAMLHRLFKTSDPYAVVSPCSDDAPTFLKRMTDNQLTNTQAIEVLERMDFMATLSETILFTINKLDLYLEPVLVLQEAEPNGYIEALSQIEPLFDLLMDLVKKAFPSATPLEMPPQPEPPINPLGIALYRLRISTALTEMYSMLDPFEDL